jgi:hypothetical protein
MIPARKAPGLAMTALSLLAPLLPFMVACTGQIPAASGGNAPGTTGPNGPGGGAGPGSSGSGPGSSGSGPGSSGSGPGSAGGGTPNPMPGPDGVIDSAGPYALRRLTVLEYQNTVRDLLGVNLAETDSRGFAADQVLRGGFGSGAAIVTSVDSRQFLDVSDKIATAATADLTKLMPAGCAAPAPAGEADCIAKFVDQLGLRAFRRPLAADEAGRFVALFTQLRSPAVGAPFNEAVHDLLLAFLQSPEFLYRWELDGDPIKDGDLIKFGPYEIASRLSYFLWASMPDDQLFAAAKSGGLASPDQIATQADRMLKDDRAKDGLRDFHMQWLGLYGVDGLDKDPSFTTYTPEVAKAMLAESSAFIDSIIQAPTATGKFEDLFTSSTSFVNEALAKHYGVAGVTGAALQKVNLNPQQRAGILTQGAYLANHAKEVDSFPIARGVHLLRQVLCQELPEPNIMLPPAPEQTPGVTTRKLYADFTAAPACQACHARINGVGFGLENYDATGGYRDKEEGQMVDASGSIALPSGTLTYQNGVELVKAIAKSPEARECVARNWMRALLRREESKLEGGSLKAANQAFASSSFDLRSLIVGMTKTRAFTHRNPVAGAGN